MPQAHGYCHDQKRFKIVAYHARHGNGEESHREGKKSQRLRSNLSQTGIDSRINPFQYFV
jgi:hypothetical protein